MSEIEERRADCKERHSKLDLLWIWFHGNGNKGSGERLQKVEDIINGKEPCNAMKKIDDHLNWHKESKKYMWGILVPLYVMLLTMFLQVIGVI